MINELTKKVFIIGAAITLLTAVFGLLGYVPGLHILGSVHPDYIPMAPSTAVSFLILGIGLIRLGGKTAFRQSDRLFRILTGLVIVYACLDLAGYLTGLDLNLEETLMPALGKTAGARIGLMSPATAAGFVLSGLGVLFLFPNGAASDFRDSFRRISGYFSAAGLVAGLTFLLGYIFGTPLFYNTGTVPMALTTAVGFIAFNSAVIAVLGADSFPLTHFLGSSTYTRLMRSFFPLLLIALIVQSLAAHWMNALAGVDYPIAAAALAVVAAAAAAAVFAAEARRVGNVVDQRQREQEKAEKELMVSREKYKSLFNSIRDAILVADTNRSIIGINPAFTSLFGYTMEDLEGQKTVFVYENEEQYQELGQALQKNFGRDDFLKTVNYQKKSGEVFPGETGVYYLQNEQGEITGFIGLIRDISERVRIEREKEDLIRDLKNALAEVKALSGLLPICSSCKKIRDDTGYWQQLEVYIHEHSQAQFSHGLCPPCAKKLYPEFDLEEEE